MPRKKVKPDPTRLSAVPLTPELLARFRALDTPTDVDLNCICCQHGIGIAKKRTPAGRLVCLPCVWTLAHHRPTNDPNDWMMRRLPYFRDYVTHPDRRTAQAA